ncbi:MAG: 3-hydroxyacyl-ACP dehydratase FabZ [Alphaproteobacteria bacterium]|nr:3-hydroxyacyl-ACP dehydratase FabZ [Alphaproteobacteria bacterium]
MSQAAEKTELESADVKRLMELLPHRAPMLMVDRLIDIVPQVSATGIKCVSINEPYFAGHFPGHPVMPGVLIVEAMAQAAGALVVHSLGGANMEKIVYFMTIDKARFRHPVVPGDQLIIPVKVLRSRGPVWRFSGEAYVNGKLCAEAEYSAMIVQPNAQPEAVE